MENLKKLTEEFKELFLDKTSSPNLGSPLLKANETYNKFISKGLIKKRGYTLRGLEDSHLVTFNFNILNLKSNS